MLQRRASSSLDSLDFVEVPSSVTSTSNDSGFTTLSGEDEDCVYSTHTTAPTSVSTVSNNGLNLSPSVTTNSVKVSNMEDVRYNFPIFYLLRNKAIFDIIGLRWKNCVTCGHQTS